MAEAVTTSPPRTGVSTGDVIGPDGATDGSLAEFNGVSGKRIREIAGRLSIVATTWANRPAAASYPGSVIRVSDIGTSGSLWISDGTRWYPLNGQVMLGQSGTPVSCGANTSENFLASVTVPAAALGLHGRLAITTMWSFTASANAKTARIRFSGNSGTIFRDLDVSGGSSAAVQNALGATIVNAGAANAQTSAQSAAGSTAVAAVTATVDTGAADTTVVFSGQKALAGDTFTLLWYFVTLATP